MDANRRRELEQSLRTRLAAQPAAARLPWLAEQLENYVERWVGFEEAFPVSSPAPRSDDLFGMIEIGAAAVDDEIGRPPPEAWRTFLEVLAAEPPRDPARLRVAFALANQALRS